MSRRYYPSGDPDNAVNNPIPKAWSDYVTQMANVLDVASGVLYDTATYTDNVTTVLNFFQTQRATADLSNMQQPGQLPYPNSFLLQALRVYFKIQLQTADSGAAAPTNFASVANDIALLTNTGILRMQIGEKRYGPWPLWMLPSASGPDVRLSMAGAEAANITQTYAQNNGALYAMFPHLMIASMQQFFVTLEWPAGAVDLTGNVVIQVLFDGQIARSVQ